MTQTPTHPGIPSLKIYPNPVLNDQPLIILLSITSTSDVRVEIFTLAFRKVNELNFSQVAPGGSVTVPLTDRWNKPLADGLYYVVIKTGQGRSIGKLLIFR